MNIDAKRILSRWQSLEKGDGLKRAASIGRIIRMISCALFIFGGFAIRYNFHPALLVIPAFVSGWMLAEANAIRVRLEQWPVVKPYIDWKKVEEDLKG